MINLIRGKVARILNAREVAINVGSMGGVRPGMQFDILDPALHDITDPDTGEVIGSVNRPKVRVRVGLVEQKFSIAQTFRTRRVNIGGSSELGILAGLVDLRPSKWVDKPETLKTSEKTWEDLGEKDSYVKIGDPVVQVPEEMKTE